ncbi:hypothetical protein EYZ11_003069 [Aspergillus tanneri]|uniref:Uncharacterized protein n=1 Tax=Aspergillus tanneri TaxID=1220188 RepID=A0A4S3JPS7_9EURO|nr:hypothetical protein EYZ11_003069 [Aspergillus tanneri]
MTGGISLLPCSARCWSTTTNPSTNNPEISTVESAVRIAFEPINYTSGTCHDQFNQFKQLAIEKSLNKLQKFGWDVNLDQYHELVNNLCLSVTEQQTL